MAKDNYKDIRTDNKDKPSRKADNVKLSDNFWLKEFFVDNEHPRKARELFEDHTTSQLDLCYQQANQLMQPVRNHLKGKFPDIDPRMHITSGYRDKELNKLNSYTKFSLHMRTLANDYRMLDRKYNYVLLEAYEFTRDYLDYGELILYQTPGGIFTNIHNSIATVGYKGIHKRKVRQPDGSLTDYEV